MKKVIIVVLIILSVSFESSAQGTIQDTTVALLGSFMKNMKVWRPPLYTSNVTSGHPLMIFFPGQGESSGAASGLALYGMMKLIADGFQPYAVNGKLPIIVACQTGDYPSEAVIQDAVTRIRGIYRCDTNMVSVHGWSMGGQSTMYVLGSPAYGRTPAFLVNYQGVSIGTTTGPHNVAMNYVRPMGKKVWAIEGVSDLRDLSLLIDTINANISGAGKYTQITSGSGSTHSGAGWTRVYDTANKWAAIGGVSAYEYTMQQTKAGNTSPTAVAGSDATITLPTSSFSRTGTDSDTDGTIVTRAWTRISGPNTPGMTGNTAATVTIGATGTAMIAGTYVYRYTVTDNGGATGYDEVTITVNAAPPVVTKKHYGLIKL